MTAIVDAMELDANITALTFCPQQRLVVGSDERGMVRSWQPPGVAPATERTPLTGHVGPVPVLAWLPDAKGGILVSGGTDGSVRAWHPASGAPVSQGVHRVPAVPDRGRPPR